MPLGLKNLWDVDRALPVHLIFWDLPTLAQIWVWLIADWLTQGWNSSDDVQKAFCYLVVLWIKFTFPCFLPYDWAMCQDVKCLDSVWFTQQKKQQQERWDSFFFFNWMGRKHFLFQCILRFWMKVLDSRESFHFLWSPYTEGVTFMPVLATGRGETWKIEWPGYPEVSRDWKWSPPQINGFLGNQQVWMLESAQFRELTNWRFPIFSQCPCFIFHCFNIGKTYRYM